MAFLLLSIYSRDRGLWVIRDIPDLISITLIANLPGMKTYIGDPQVTTAILKFVTEFVTNKVSNN